MANDDHAISIPDSAGAADDASAADVSSISIPQIPPLASPRLASGFPSVGGTASPNPGAGLSASAAAAPSPTPRSLLSEEQPELSEAQKVEIVKKYLLTADDQRHVDHGVEASAISLGPGPGPDESAEASDSLDNSEYPTPYALPGGDVVAPIYKWANQHEESGISLRGSMLRRTKSMTTQRSRRGSRGAESAAASGVQSPGGSGISAEGTAITHRDLLVPGGFRREFVRRRQVAPSRFTRSFTDFLTLYGHFGGEDLEDFDEEDEDEGSASVPTERDPLLPRTREVRSEHAGEASRTEAVFMLLKSFVGTGVLFLGKAFFNGGVLFSTIVLCVIAMVSLMSFLLLVETRFVVHGSFGDIGGILYGKYMRALILFSIVVSQLGFVSAYTIFVAENLQAFIMAVTQCSVNAAKGYLIVAQLVVFLPLAMVRNIQKLSGTALVADAFILFGLLYIFANEISVLSKRGVAEIKLFNSKDFPLLIGTAVFSFEGIGLVIPITESMKNPREFPAVLTGVMIGVMILFAGAGVLAYLAYGPEIQTVVFLNLPQDDKFVNVSQLLYSLAILLSIPLQFFPAVRILENGIFARSGKHSPQVKWQKNSFRTGLVLFCACISWMGASDLDKFVSLIGSFACVPLCFCYPPLLHLKAVAETRRQKLLDYALFVFGALAATYTTYQTVKIMATSGPSVPKGDCPL